MDNFITYAIADQPRGCGGSRDVGGVYLETGFSPFGNPLEDFLCDPIIRCNPEEIGLSPRAPLLIQTTKGTWNVIDWIGEHFYPNRSDWLEETRKLGISRKLELSADQYGLLTPASRFIPVIPGAWIDPDLLGLLVVFQQTMEPIGYDWFYCPKKKPEHDGFENEQMEKRIGETCAGFLWQQCSHNALPHPQFTDDSPYRMINMPAFTYAGVDLNLLVKDWNPDLLKPGFIGAFPIGRIAVVQDSEGGTHVDKLKKLEGCHLRVDLVEM